MASWGGPVDLVVGIGGTVLGIAMLWSPYRVARVEERLDAIGSKRNPEYVEPTEFKIAVTRVLGGVFVLLSLTIMLAVLGVI